MGFHRNASQRSSIHEAQFDTMMSLAMGRQTSGAPLLNGGREELRISVKMIHCRRGTYPLFLVTVSTGIHQIPVMRSASREDIDVKTPEMSVPNSGNGVWRRLILLDYH